MQNHGTPPRICSATGDAEDPVLGTRGTKDGVGPGFDDYDYSPTLQLHGAPDTWVGNVCFSDHHIELLDHFFPTAFNPAGDASRVVLDNMFSTEFAHPDGNEAAADAWLGICRSASADGKRVREAVDRLID